MALLGLTTSTHVAAYIVVILGTLVAALDLFGTGLAGFPVPFRAQIVGIDLVRVLGVVPLLLATTTYSHRLSLPARLVLLGGLAEILVTFSTYAILPGGGSLLMGLSITIVVFAVIGLTLGVLSIPTDGVPRAFPDTPGRRAAVVGTILLGVALCVLLMTGIATPFQAYDAGLAAALVILGGALMLARNGWGWVLGVIGLVRSGTLAASWLATTLYLGAKGVPVPPIGAVAAGAVILVAAILIAGVVHGESRQPE